MPVEPQTEIPYRDYAEDGAGAYFGQFAADGARVQRTWDVSWDRHDGTLQKFLGRPTVDEVQGDDGVRRRCIRRDIPIKDPLYPNLFCASIPRVEAVKLKGVRKASTAPDYDTARLHLEFRSFLYDIVKDENVSHPRGMLHGLPNEADGLVAASANPLLLPENGDKPLVPRRFVTIMVKPASRVVTLRRGMMRVIGRDGPGDVIPEGIPLSESRTAVTVTWHDVPVAGVPIQAITSQIGTINAYPTADYPIGTLLLDGATLTPGLSPFGDRLYQIQYIWMFAPNIFRHPPKGVVPDPLGWNAVLHYKKKGFAPADGWEVIEGGIAAAAVRGLAGRAAPPGGAWGAQTVDLDTVDYFYVSSDGTKKGTLPYRFSDFGNLFIPDQP